MTDTLIPGSSVEESAELKKRKARERQRRHRDKTSDDPEVRRKRAKAQWADNLQGLSREDRRKTAEHVREWGFIYRLMGDACKQLRGGRPYGEGEVYPQQAFLEIEDFARRFPATDGLESYHLFDFDERNDLTREPYYFRTFGLTVDHIDHVRYYDFLHLFKEWYRQHRNTTDVVAEWGWESTDEWDEVDEAAKANPRVEV